ncbi:h domain protein [Nocardia sp. NPDC057353]|uniref:h domain protein n=1 Tax=Nocardia sp. NPDC057353 TaxID=3346104 RepID=UPI0036337F26
MKLSRTKILAGAAAVLLLAAAVLAGVNGYRLWDDNRTEQARTDATSTASRTVAAMFSYDFNTVDTELPKAADNLTPDFRADYLTLIQDAIAPGAKEKQLSVQADTQAAGIVSADANNAVVMLFLNQITTSKDSPDGTTSGSRVSVELNRDGDRWLVAAVTPV